MKRGLGKIRSKKGASHFEMIVAFVLFFAFVGFLLVYIRPYKTGTLQASVVAGLHDSFKEQAETNLTKFFLKANNSDSAGVFRDKCFTIDLNQKLFGYVFTDTFVKSVDEVEKKSNLENSGGLDVGSVDSEEVLDDVFYYVMISPEFDDSAYDCSHSLNEYMLGGINEKRIISYKQLLEMKERYENDYANLKKDMNFPEAYDFSIVSSLITMEGVVPEEGDIIADDFIEEVLFADGTIINQRFTLKVW